MQTKKNPSPGKISFAAQETPCCVIAEKQFGLQHSSCSFASFVSASVVNLLSRLKSVLPMWAVHTRAVLFQQHWNEKSWDWAQLVHH